MSNQGMQNPFAPPVANVQDHVESHAAEMVEATRLSRFLAFLIDCAPGFVVGIALAIGMAAYFARHPGSGLASVVAGFGIFIGVFVLAVVGWMIYNGVLAYRYGQIFGKRMMGIRVVRTDGSRVSFARFIFLRWLPLALLSGCVGWVLGRMGHPGSSYIVGLIDILLIFRASRHCLHDDIADTMVVTAASSESATLAGTMYPTLRSANF
jgi:uncharacterized RDD family membrane protein YckC